MLVEKYINILLNYLFDSKLDNIKNDVYIEFLGLCKRKYKNGFKNNIEIYEYIKGSHYFNKRFFEFDKDFYNYLMKNPKQIEFDEYKFFYIVIKEFDKISNFDKQYFDNCKIQYQKAILINFFQKYPNVEYSIDKTHLKNRLHKFFNIYVP